MANTVEIVLKAVDQTGGVFSKLGASMISLQSGLMLAEKGFKALEDAYKATIGETVNYTTSVIDMARLIGLSTEETSKLIQASDDLFLTQEKLQIAMQAATRQGIDVSIDGLKSLADEYLSLEPGLERSQFLLQTFGRSGADMGKLMEVGADGIDKMTSAIQDNLIVTEQGAANVIAYKQSLDEMQDSWTGIKNEIGNAVIPVLTKNMNKLMENTEWNKRLRYETDRLNISWRGGVGTLEDGTYVTAEFIDQIIRAEKAVEVGWNRFDKMSGSIERASTAASDFEFYIGQAIDKVLELDDINVNFGDTIISEFEKLKFYEAGGGELQGAATKLSDLMETGIGSANVEELVNQLFIGQQAVAVEAGTTSAYAAKTAIIQTLGLTWAEADSQLKAWLADIDGSTFTLNALINYQSAMQTTAGQYGNTGGYYNPGTWTPPPGKAGGGPVWGATPYVVGEKGPELFVPEQNGTIVPNKNLGGNQVTFYGDAYLEIKEDLKDDILSQLRLTT